MAITAKREAASSVRAIKRVDEAVVNRRCALPLGDQPRIERARRTLPPSKQAAPATPGSESSDMLAELARSVARSTNAAPRTTPPLPMTSAITRFPTQPPRMESSRSELLSTGRFRQLASNAHGDLHHEDFVRFALPLALRIAS